MSRIFAKCASFVVAFACVAMAHAASIRIDLKPQIKTAASQLTLGDVAALYSSDLPTLVQLNTLPLGRVPRPGQKIELEREQLERWVRSQTRLGASVITWGGAASIEIETVGQDVPGERIEAAARSSLQEWLRARYVHFEIGEASSIPAMVVRNGRVDLQVRALPDSQPPTSRMNVWVDVRVDGEWARTVPVSFPVAAYQTVTVATKPLPVGHELDASDYVQKEMDVTKMPIKTAVQLDKGDGVRLRRSVGAGGVLSDGSVESVPLVTRGSWVVLKTSRGMVNLESRVEVLQDGRKGQSVRVKAPGAKGSVQAKVVGKDLLTISD